MQRFFDQIEALTDIGAVLRYARETCWNEGVLRMSYHIAPLFDEKVVHARAVYSAGFSEEWLALYDDRDFRSADPIPQRVMRHGAMMTWQDAMIAGANTAENEEYFSQMRSYGLIHGFGVPLFGPGGRDAYACFDFEKPVSEVASGPLGTVRSVAQACHQRICVLLDESAKIPALSEREVEVLTWTARGKSVSSIATILDLSPDTVKTYSKRIYAKLNVTDRIGAVVKALRMGLVEV